MRVQLQQQRGGRTIHHGSRVLRAAGGVAVQQLVAALQDLRANPAIPSRERTAANAALADAVRWAHERPPAGVDGLFRKSFYFDRLETRRSWRFDVEGLSGANLRS